MRDFVLLVVILQTSSPAPDDFYINYYSMRAVPAQVHSELLREKEMDLQTNAIVAHELRMCQSLIAALTEEKEQLEMQVDVFSFLAASPSFALQGCGGLKEKNSRQVLQKDAELGRAQEEIAATQSNLASISSERADSSGDRDARSVRALPIPEGSSGPENKLEQKERSAQDSHVLPICAVAGDVGLDKDTGVEEARLELLVQDVAKAQLEILRLHQRISSEESLPDLHCLCPHHQEDRASL